MSVSRQESYSKISTRLYNLSYDSKEAFIGALKAFAVWAEDMGVIEDAEEWYNDALTSADVSDEEQEDLVDEDEDLEMAEEEEDEEETHE